VTALDWIIVAITLLMAFWGYLQGLVAGALALIGFGAGALLGSRIGPLLLDEGSRSPYAALSALMGALLIGFACVVASASASACSTGPAERFSWLRWGSSWPGSWARWRFRCLA
jgi:uncharacterized membrane protein required for colicin V production